MHLRVFLRTLLNSSHKYFVIFAYPRFNFIMKTLIFPSMNSFMNTFCTLADPRSENNFVQFKIKFNDFSSGNYANT